MNHWIPYGFGTMVNVTWGYRPFTTCIMRQTLGKTHLICSLIHIHSGIAISVTQHLCRWQQHVTLSKVWTVLRLESLSCPCTGKAGRPDSDLSPLRNIHLPAQKAWWPVCWREGPNCWLEEKLTSIPWQERWEKIGCPVGVANYGRKWANTSLSLDGRGSVGLGFCTP